MVSSVYVSPLANLGCCSLWVLVLAGHDGAYFETTGSVLSFLKKKEVEVERPEVNDQPYHFLLSEGGSVALWEPSG